MFTREMTLVSEQSKQLMELFPILNTIEDSLATDSRNVEQSTDITFMCRKIKEILESVEKKVNAIETRAAANIVETLPFLTSGMGKYKTEYCTVSDNSTFYVKFPVSPSKEGYDEFVKQLPLDAMRPHYPTIAELITKELENGGQIPFGLPAYGIISVAPKLRVTPHKEL